MTLDNGAPMLDVLIEALHARPEIAQRADRCRAVLADLLGSRAHANQRELNLLVTAVEQGAPASLLATLGTSDYDAISAQLSAERALELDAARWAVRTWSAALLAVNAASPETLAPMISSATPAAGAAPPNPAALLTPTKAPTGDSTIENRPPGAGDLWNMAVQKPASPRSRQRQPWSRQRKRLVTIGSGSLAVIVIAAGTVAFAAGGSSSKKNASSTSTSSTSVPATTTTVVVDQSTSHTDLKYSTVPIGTGVKVTRTWDLSGTTGDAFTGTLNFVATKRPSKPIVYDEVLPKSLAASSAAIHVDYARELLPQRPVWVQKDPILRITLGFTKSSKITVTYRVKVSPKGRGAARLQAWRKDQATVQKVWVLLHQPVPASLVAIPNVVGEPSATAATQLSQASFVVNIRYAQSTRVATDRVISTSPGPNVQVPKGSTVTLTVSTGTGSAPVLITVKNVTGEGLPQAQSDLASLGFNVSVNYVTDAAHVNQVISQAPSGGTQQPRGTTITLTVGKAPIPTGPSDKDGDGVPDSVDRCPTVPGPASNHGCPVPPDRDKDGVPDASDRCPTIPGPAANHGCPYLTFGGLSGPPPVVTASCPSQTYLATFHASATGAAKFEWSVNGGSFSAGGPDRSYTLSPAPRYTITVRVTGYDGTTKTASQSIEVDPSIQC